MTKIRLATFGLVMLMTTGAFAQVGENGISACQFDSLHERTKNNPFSRAAYTALQWVEYEDKAERVYQLMKATTKEPGVTQSQILITGMAALSTINKISATHPLHRCFDEAFTSNITLDTFFQGMVFVKGRLALDIPYAMVIPQATDEPVVLILPTEMYRFQRATGSLRVYDKQSQAYVTVDPQARRGIDRLVQTNLAKIKN